MFMLVLSKSCFEDQPTDRQTDKPRSRCFCSKHKNAYPELLPSVPLVYQMLIKVNCFKLCELWHLYSYFVQTLWFWNYKICSVLSNKFSWHPFRPFIVFFPFGCPAAALIKGAVHSEPLGAKSISWSFSIISRLEIVTILVSTP